MKTIQPDADPINKPHNRGQWLDNDRVFGCSARFLREAAKYIDVEVEAFKMFTPRELRDIVDEIKEVEKEKMEKREEMRKKYRARRGSAGGIKLSPAQTQPAGIQPTPSQAQADGGVQLTPSETQADDTVRATSPAPPPAPKQHRNDNIKGVDFWLRVLYNSIYRYLLRKDGETAQTLKEYSRFGLGDMVEEAYEKSYVHMRLSQDQLDDLFRKVQGRLNNPLLRIPRTRRVQEAHWSDERRSWQKENPEWEVIRDTPVAVPTPAVATTTVA